MGGCAALPPDRAITCELVAQRCFPGVIVGFAIVWYPAMYDVTVASDSHERPKMPEEFL